MLIDGDTVTYLGFPPTITVLPGKLTASGPATLTDKKVCIEGDEASGKVENVPYSMPPFVGGTGTLEIVQLMPNHKATKTKTGSTAMLLLGATFIATFKVVGKATNPATGATDPTPEYPGQGKFVTTNTKFRGS
ncbi:hypothetical protein ACNOYE_14580 [Nannocystaceae bacterium ST9]